MYDHVMGMVRMTGMVLALSGSFAAYGHAAAKQDKNAPARTIVIEMREDENTGAMSFSPNGISVKKGENIRFELHNKGVLPHEMAIGTDKALAAHEQEMAEQTEDEAENGGEAEETKSGDMHHDMHHDMGHDMGHGAASDDMAVNVVTVEPGEQQDLYWKVTDQRIAQAVCLFPGHREAGMVLRITVL